MILVLASTVGWNVFRRDAQFTCDIPPIPIAILCSTDSKNMTPVGLTGTCGFYVHAHGLARSSLAICNTVIASHL